MVIWTLQLIYVFHLFLVFVLFSQDKYLTHGQYRDQSLLLSFQRKGSWASWNKDAWENDDINAWVVLSPEGISEKGQSATASACLLWPPALGLWLPIEAKIVTPVHFQKPAPKRQEGWVSPRKRSFWWLGKVRCMRAELWWERCCDYALFVALASRWGRW